MLGIFAILCFLCLVFVVWRSCSKPEIDPRERAIDSMVQRDMMQRIEFKHFQDSIYRVLAFRDSIIRHDSMALVKAVGDARKSTQIASYYARKYDSAKQAMDTVAMIHACDSLRWQIATITEAMDTAVAQSAALINGLYSKIDLQNAYIGGLEQRVQQQDSTIVSMAEKVKPIIDENIQLRKAVKKARRTGNAKFVAGAGLGAIIRGLFK